jgi:hypothetical protein
MARKKMSGVADYIVPLGIVGLAAYVLYKMGLFNGSLFDLSGGNNGKAAAQTSAIAHSAFTASAAKVPQSLDDTTLNTMLNTIISDAGNNCNIGSGTGPTDDIVSQLSNLDNITDLYRLMDLWGTRAMGTSCWGPCATIGVDCSQQDFGTFLHNILSTDQLASVNEDLGGNGINYTFN